MTTPIPQWPGEPLRLGDREVFVRRASSARDDAEPGLFVHGLAGSSANWTDLMGLLSGEVAGDAIDLPGFGGLAAAARPRLLRRRPHSHRRRD